MLFNIKKLIFIILCGVMLLGVYLWMRSYERDDMDKKGWPAAITWNEPYVGYINVYCQMNGLGDGFACKLFLRDKEASLCLPSFASKEELRLDFDEKYFELYLDGERYIPGNLISLSKDLPLKILYKSDAYGTIERDYELTVLKSENLPALFLTTKSGSTQYMDEDKEHLDGGNLTILDENGNADTAARISFMHAKGQSSFTLAKKSYKLELSREATPLGLPYDKKWVLVANAMDATLMRNALAYSLAKELGIEDTVEYRFVDAYFNGEYRGNYLLTQVVEHGFMEKYANNKDDFLLEVETWEERLKEDSVYIKRGESMWMEFLWPIDPDEEMKKRAGEVLDAWEQTSDAESDRFIVDEDSFAKKYILDTLTNEPDSNSHSTFYFYSPEHGGLHAAPVWDYDRAWGNRPEYNEYPEFESYTHGWQQMMMEDEDFRRLVEELFLKASPYMESVPDKVIPDLYDTLEASRKMDYCINGDPISSVYNAGSYEANVRYLSEYYRRSFEALSDYLGDFDSWCRVRFDSAGGRVLRLKKGEAIGAERFEYLKKLYKCRGFSDEEGKIIDASSAWEENDKLLYPVT